MRRMIAPLSLLVILALGCSRPTAPPVSAPVVSEQPAAVAPRAQQPEQPQAGSVADQQATIARWSVAVQRDPTADNWNELSYAYIQAGQWEAAAEAGRQALTLQSKHPYALYNTGLALLEAGSLRSAALYLREMAELQPDRPEPEIALARAHQGLGQYRLAHFHAGRGVTLSGGSAEAKKVAQAVEAMLLGAPPDGYASQCVQRLTHGKLFLCLVQEADERFTLLVAPDGRPVQRIPVGNSGAGPLTATRLPDGQTGFWLQGPYIGAMVAGTVEWRLFAWDGERMSQILFTGGDSYEGRSSDFMRAPGLPRIDHDSISVGQRDDMTGSIRYRTVRRLSLAESEAAVISFVMIIPGEITGLGSMISVTGAPGYPWTYPLADGAHILLDGKPSRLTEISRGMRATIEVEHNRITLLDAVSR